MHTKGPWYVRQDRSFYVNHEQPYCIANKPECEDIDEDTSWICRLMDLWDKEAKANAKLIAAAPEMLEVLKFTLNELNNMTTVNFSLGSDKPIRDKIEEIIYRLE